MRQTAPKQIAWNLDIPFKRRIPYAFDTLVVDEYTGIVGKTVLQWGDDERTRRDIAPGDLIQLTKKGERWTEVYVINLKSQTGGSLKFTVGGPELIIRPQVTQERLVDTTGTVINPATQDKQNAILSKLTMTLTELAEAIRGTGNKTLTDLDAALGNGTVVVDGTVNVGTVVVQLPNIPVRQGTAALLRLLPSASDSIRIGGNSPSFILEKGERITIPVDNLNRIYAQAVSGTQTLYYMVVQ